MATSSNLVEVYIHSIYISVGPDIRFHAHEEFGDRRDKVVSARTYFYEDEAHCDENMENFFKGIDAVSGNCNWLKYTNHSCSECTVLWFCIFSFCIFFKIVQYIT